MGCEICGYHIPMIPTPAEVLPLVASLAAPTYKAVQAGIDFADGLMPDDQDVADPWYWSHSARYAARNQLRHGGAIEGWKLRPDVPNSGIHFSVDNGHRLRLVRSLHNDVPHPGSNKRRREAWTGAVELPLRVSGSGLPFLNLLFDWAVDINREPVIHVTLPQGPWTYGQPSRVHWRVLLPSDGVLDLSALTFNPSGDGDDLGLVLDEAERESG